MGWDFQRDATKKDVIAELTAKRDTHECLAKAVRGNVLWTVEHVRYTKQDGTLCETDIIGCYLLGSERGFGWGSKSMSESMGPAYYNCPLNYLDKVPCPGGYAIAWREKVRAFHSKQSAKKSILKNIKVGSRVRLIDGCKIMGDVVSELTITSVKPLLGQIGFMDVRIRPRHIAEVLDNQ